MANIVHQVTENISGGCIYEIRLNGKLVWKRTYYLTGASKFDKRAKAELAELQEQETRRLLGEAS